jgi:hypothetical protein
MFIFYCDPMDRHRQIARQLAALYSRQFGGKGSGRYRISSKQMRELLGQRRLYPDDISQVTRHLLEEGYILIDMDSFFAVLSANAFVNYRRVNAEAIKAAEQP